MKVLPADDLIGQATPCNMYLYNIEMCFVISIHIVNKLKFKIEIDVLVVIVYISHCNCWIIYYCTRIEVSVLRAGRGGGGGGLEVFVRKKNVPGVLKRKKKCGGGAKSFFSLQIRFFFQKCSWGDIGVFGAPHAPPPPPGGSRGVGKRYTSSYDHDP